MTSQLQATLQTLTATPSTDQPFLSIYLDWSTDGSGQRPAIRQLEQQLDLIAAQLAGDAERRPGFAADQQRIMAYVQSDAPRDARGLAIFACEAEGVWHTLPLQAPLETRVVVDRYPHVFQLARAIDDYETSAVVLVEGQQAHIFVIALDQAERVGETQAAEKIKRFDQGGQAQMLFQRRTDNIIKAHIKEVAARLEQAIQRYNVRHVVIAGNDSIKGMVLAGMPEAVKSRLVNYIHLDITSNLQAIRETIEPMLREVERQHEAAALAELEKQMTARDGLGALGVADVALALGKGQVGTLLLLASFEGTGGECPSCGMLRAGQRSNCPYDGAELQPVDLREAFTARAIQQGADVEIVEASEYLAAHEGAAALLRYRDSDSARAVGGT